MNAPRTLHYALLLAAKDLRVAFRDRTALLLTFLLPIALVSVFGFVMQFAFGGGSGMGKATLWVADQDGSAASQRFVAALRDSDTVAVQPGPGDSAVTAESLRKDVADGEAHHALVIEKGFGDELAAGRLPRLTMLRDPGRVMEDRMIAVGLMQALMTTTNGQTWPALLGHAMRRAGMADAQVQRVVDRARVVQGLISGFLGGQSSDDGDDGSPAGAPAPDVSSFFAMVPVVNVDLAPPDRPVQTTYMLAQTVAGMTVMMLMFGLVACGTTLIVEREHGTLRRLLLSAAPRNSILLGKLLFTYAIGLLQLVVLFTFGELVFHVGIFRDPLTLSVLALVLVATVAAFGMLIAAWARTQKQAEGVSTLLILSMSALGGAWFPIQLATLPAFAGVVTRCTLTWWAMSGLQAMLWNGKGLTDAAVLLPIAVQLGFAVVATALAWRLFRRAYAHG